MMLGHLIVSHEGKRKIYDGLLPVHFKEDWFRPVYDIGLFLGLTREFILLSQSKSIFFFTFVTSPTTHHRQSY